jgi:hypothetical protein
MPQPVKNNGETTVSNTAIEQQLALLGAIQVIKFAANPSRLQPFQSTTISYQIKLPAALKVPVTFSIGSHNFGHALSGSGSFAVTTNTTFALHAATALTGKNIATAPVTVDTAQCRLGAIPGLGITATLKSNLDQNFKNNLRGTGSTVTLGAGTISIQIPLTLGSGKGTMDLGVQLVALQNGESVSVGDSSVTVQIHLDTDLNVGSWCSNAMQDVVKPFMQHIVDSEIVPAIQQQLTDQINGLISSSQKSDPMHRGFALTSFSLTSDGVTFMVCPTTPGVEVGGSHTIAERSI